MKNPGIYVLTSPSGNQYIGKDSNLPSRVRKHLSGKDLNCRAIHNSIQKYGRDAFSVEIIQYPGISHEALKSVERWWIQRLQTFSPSGYNLTEGGEGLLNPSPETRQKMSTSARRTNKKRVADGTHNLLDGEISRGTQKKRVKDGTHHFLGGELQRGTQKKRVKDGTHHLLGESNPVHKRVKDGTHHLLGESNPVHKRVKDGTHNFLGGEISRSITKKRLEDGTHNFLGENHPSKQRVKDGIHNLLGDRNPSHQRVKDGTHNFLGENNPMKQLAKEGKHPSTRKRIKGEWCYIIALSRFWYEIHDYTLKRRAEFLSKDIPDTSNAEQTYLF